MYGPDDYALSDDEWFERHPLMSYRLRPHPAANPRRWEHDPRPKRRAASHPEAAGGCWAIVPRRADLPGAMVPPFVDLREPARRDGSRRWHWRRWVGAYPVPPRAPAKPVRPPVGRAAAPRGRGTCRDGGRPRPVDEASPMACCR